MKILILHQHYKKPDQPGSHRSYYLAKALAKQGHEVELITSHGQRGYQTSRAQPFKIHYLPIRYYQKMNSLRRIWAFIVFIARTAFIATFMKKVDLVYAISTPLTVGFIALYLKRIKGVPYYFEVGDLWPQAPIELGVIKNKFLQNYLYGLEKKIYTKASKIVALSPGIKEYIEKNGGEGKTFIVPNMSDTNVFSTTNKSTFPIGLFRIVYFGAVGRANHLEYLLELVMHCKYKKTPVKFSIIGNGSEKKKLRSLVEWQNIMDTIDFTSEVAKIFLARKLRDFDAFYISFADKAVLQTGSPNKFFDGLAAGKMCITNVDGWIRELVEQYNCGIYVPPGKPYLLSEKIEEMKDDPFLLQMYQKNARNLAENYFAVDKITEEFVKLF